MKSQETILKAISSMIPEDTQKEVTEAISTFVEGTVKELDEEYNQKLEEGFKQAHDEVGAAEKVAEEGYAQAWEIITDLRNRLEIQKEEFEQALEEGYEQAYKMLQEERAKNDTLEVDLYEEYDKKLNDLKEYIVDKVDQFLELQGEKYYEMAKRDVMNDPTVTEHKLAFDKILEVASNYITDEEHVFQSSSRVDSLQKTLEDTKGQMKIMEAKNMRLKSENDKLNEAVRQQHDLLTEHTQKTEKKERIEKSKKVVGRGETGKERQVVLGEWKESSEPVATSDNDDDNLVEQVGEEVFEDWKHLSGLTKEEDA